MTRETTPARKRALLVGVHLDGVTEAQHRASMAELSRLVKTLGFDVVGELTQRRRSLDGGVVLGEGKLVELAGWTGGTGKVETKPPRKPQKKDPRGADDQALLGLRRGRRSYRVRQHRSRS